MAMSKIELLEYPPKANWLVGGMFPLGHLSLVYAAGGIGKTRLISHLAVEVTRPQGEGLFLGHIVKHGKVLILDADDPTGFGYQTWLNRFLGWRYDAKRELIELRAITGGLTPNDVQALHDELLIEPRDVVIIDTFASAFIGLDVLKGHHVQQVLTELADLAKTLNCAVVMLDHVGKLQPGQTVVSKGPYGAAKTFSPRAIFALSRVPPKEMEGRDVLRLDCTKMSYAAEPAPIGLEIILEQNDTVARVKLADLPHAGLSEKAREAIIKALESAKGEAMPRQALLSAAVNAANITQRYAEKVLKELLESHPDIEELTLPGRGNPKAYRMCYINSSSNSKNADRDRVLFDEQPSSSNQVSSLKESKGLLHELPIEQTLLLKSKVEKGEWDIPNVQQLLRFIDLALSGNQDAIEAICAYLENESVQAGLGLTSCQFAFWHDVSPNLSS